jgi:hypothetical protein
MKWTLLFCAVFVATLPCQMSLAGQKDDDDIVILAVKPRSPDVKPIAAPVSPKGQDISKPQAAQAGVQVSRR